MYVPRTFKASQMIFVDSERQQIGEIRAFGVVRMNIAVVTVACT